MTETIDSTPVLPTERTTAGGMNRINVAIWAGVILIMAVLGWGLIEAKGERPDKVAPDFELSFFDGYEWQGESNAKLSDFRGRPVVLNFWASWCVECKIEADVLEQTWRAYRDDGVVFLGVAYVDVEPRSIEYLKEFDITYPNAPDLRTIASGKYEVTGVPETFFIDQEGNVTHIQIGPVSQTMLTGLLDQMLATGEEEPSTNSAG